MGGIVMKQFNLDEYLKNPNRKIITRDGHDVRIVCTDMKNGDNTFKDRSVIALIEEDCDRELIVCVKQNGRYSEINDCEFDLFFAPEKKEGWVNLFKINSTITTGKVYNTEEEAKSAVKNTAVINSSIYISTVKVEWEE